jgi:hypothetical protein
LAARQSLIDPMAEAEALGSFLAPPAASSIDLMTTNKLFIIS